MCSQQKEVEEPPTPEAVSERIRLSYADPARCTQLLQLYGVTIGSPSAAVDPKKLPVVVPLPPTKFHETVPDHEKVFPQTEVDPINELLLFYDPTMPEEAGKIRRIIKEQVDLPARKIMIEAMVLEISSSALDELGVQWDFNRGASSISDSNFVNTKLDGANANGNLLIGSIAYPAAGEAQLDATITNVFREFNVRLKALVQDGSAQVLSRPSVLTLDNRMAYINVSEKIPIANTKFVKDYVSALISERHGWDRVGRPSSGSIRTERRFLFKSTLPFRLRFRERIKLSGERPTILYWLVPRPCRYGKSRPMPESQTTPLSSWVD